MDETNIGRSSGTKYSLDDLVMAAVRRFSIIFIASSESCTTMSFNLF